MSWFVMPCRVVVPIESSQRSGHSMEGTRLTVVKLGKEGAPAEDDEARLVTPRAAGACWSAIPPRVAGVCGIVAHGVVVVGGRKEEGSN